MLKAGLSESPRNNSVPLRLRSRRDILHNLFLKSLYKKTAHTQYGAPWHRRVLLLGFFAGKYRSFLSAGLEIVGRPSPIPLRLLFGHWLYPIIQESRFMAKGTEWNRIFCSFASNGRGLIPLTIDSRPQNIRSQY